MSTRIRTLPSREFFVRQSILNAGISRSVLRIIAQAPEAMSHDAKASIGSEFHKLVAHWNDGGLFYNGMSAP